LEWILNLPVRRSFRRPDGTGGIVDRHADGIAVFGSGTVVVLHLVTEDFVTKPSLTVQLKQEPKLAAKRSALK
jgi:hypothetical protein